MDWQRADEISEVMRNIFSIS